MIEDQLQGLILPLPENGFSPVLWLGLFLFITLYSLALWRLRKTQNSELFKARKALDFLIKSSSSSSTASSNINPSNNKQATAIKCSQILSAGFGVKNLDQYQPANNEQWQKFHQQLNTLCYSNDSSIKLYPLLQQAKSFLLNENVADK
jgi:hypothetical protein